MDLSAQVQRDGWDISRMVMVSLTLACFIEFNKPKYSYIMFSETEPREGHILDKTCRKKYVNNGFKVESVSDATLGNI